MPGGKELFTPAGPTSISRINSNPVTPNEYISPSTRRHVGLASPSVFISPSIVNDDAAERKERRRSRVLELQRRHLSSPATPPDRRQSASLGGLSNNQLAEHYANCIKLSAENKINAKNAFGLHLIDYMSDVLKKKEMTNFQVASSTLDASAKIYAGRVDAIHSETYKVLSGLGRGSDRNKGDGNQEEEAGNDDQENAGVEKKRKKARRSNTIEANLKNINVNKFDLEFEVDPLFHKTSATFDEGGTGGLLLNHLCVRDDTSEIVLDSNTVIMNIDHKDDLPCSQAEKAKKMINLKELRELYAGVKLEPLQICPAFSDFQFTNWTKECEDLFSSQMKAAASEHAFDLDAEAEAVPARQDEEPQDFEDDGFGHMADDDDNDDAMSRVGDNEDREMLLADSKEAHVVESAMHNIKHGTVGNLMQVLAVEPGEYSYFDKNMLRTWAGPEHWKLKLKLKDSQGGGADKDAKKSKEKKEAFNLDYSEEVDFDSHFKTTRAATTLAKTTLEKYSKSQTTLPEDLHYDGDKLFKLFVKPTVMIKRQKMGLENVDDGIADYDYDNLNDRDNFCPAGGDDLGDIDDDDDNEDAPGFNFTQETDYTQNQGSFINETAADGTLLAGDGLVSQPKKVAKIDIGYAKAAKKIDVKRVKGAMWDLLVTGCPTDEDKVRKENEKDETELPTEIPDPVTFQNLCNTLPGAVSKHMAKNLSVPIAFVCLLHLANEKTLCITSDESMSDLSISQG